MDFAVVPGLIVDLVAPLLSADAVEPICTTQPGETNWCRAGASCVRHNLSIRPACSQGGRERPGASLQLQQLLRVPVQKFSFHFLVWCEPADGFECARRKTDGRASGGLRAVAAKHQLVLMALDEAAIMLLVAHDRAVA